MHRSNILGRSLVPIAQAAQLTRLSLHHVLYEEICSLPPGLFPYLERLALYRDFNPSDTKSSPARAFEDAPSLRRLVIGEWDAGSKKNYPLNHLLFPLHQLTHFLDSGTEAYGSLFFPDFFKKCSHLEYLAVQLEGFQVGDATFIPGTTAGPLYLSTVRFLNISFWGGAMENR